MKREFLFFLVDEGFEMNDCGNEIGIEKIKNCSINELKSILKEKIKPRVLQIFDKESKILILTTVKIDTTEK